MENPYEPKTGQISHRLSKRLFGRLLKRSRKRLIRYSILAANIALLVAVLLFVLRASNTSQTLPQAATTPLGNAASNPLDLLSSADIAANVAQLANLPESTSASNRAVTVNALLAVSPADQTVVAKPQIVATNFKSNKDIKMYVTVAGDTVSSLAAKFGVTSDSIRASNGLTGDSLAAGKTLYIPPVNGIVYVVKAGDTPDSLASKYSANKDQIIAFNDAEIKGLTVGERIIIPNGLLPANTGGAATFFGGGTYVATYGFNGYDFGWCTWWAANRRSQLGHPVPSNLGDAYSWFILAQRAGLPTGYTPRVGAVAVNQAGDHVSVVEQVNPDGSFWVSEMISRGVSAIGSSTPAGGWDRLDYKLYTSVGHLGFIY